jgi:hypothetical protein
MSNVKPYHKLPFCIIILVEHIVALWYDSKIISREHLECMRTCCCFKTKLDVGMGIISWMLC